MNFPAWIPRDDLPSSVMFVCPYCFRTVAYHHGSTSASRKKSGITKHCPFLFCPWCGKDVAPYKQKG